MCLFFFSSRRRHTRLTCDWSSDVCSSDLWVGAEIKRDYVPLVREHVKRADGVICVSEYTASEARLLLDVPPSKIALHLLLAHRLAVGRIDAIGHDREPVSEEEVQRVLERRRL